MASVTLHHQTTSILGAGSIKNKTNAIGNNQVPCFRTPVPSSCLRLFGGSNALIGCRLGFAHPPGRNILSLSATKARYDDSESNLEDHLIEETDTSGMLGDIKSSVLGESNSESSLKEEEDSTPFSSSSNPTNFFGSEYCTQYPVDLTMVRDTTPIYDAEYVISNYANKTIKFCAPRDFTSIDEDYNVCDGTNKELATLRKQIFTIHEGWQVYQGHNTNDKNLLFSVKSSSKKQYSKVDLDVFLPYNITQEMGDFKIAESMTSQKTWYVYMGDKIIAQIQKKHADENILHGKEKLMMYVYPLVSHAFIVALSVIVNEMDCLRNPKMVPSILTFQRLIKYMVRLTNMPLFGVLTLCFIVVKLARLFF